MSSPAHAATRYLSWAAVALVSTVGLPAAARAQQPLEPVRVTVIATEADTLEARAHAYSARWNDVRDKRTLRKAAALHERAAELRAPEDGRAFTNLQSAAILRYDAGQRAAAADLMERAADQAMARGDVLNAAGAYLDAAIVAIELRQGDRVREFARRGSLLMHSPLISPAQRGELFLRVAQRGTAGQEVAALLAP